jgi:hypothetical protein
LCDGRPPRWVRNGSKYTHSGHQSANQGCPPQRAALNQFLILASINSSHDLVAHLRHRASCAILASSPCIFQFPTALGGDFTLLVAFVAVARLNLGFCLLAAIRDRCRHQAQPRWRWRTLGAREIPPNGTETGKRPRRYRGGCPPPLTSPSTSTGVHPAAGIPPPATESFDNPRTRRSTPWPGRS